MISIHGWNVQIKACVTELPVCVCAFMDMTGLLAKEPSVLKIAIIAELVFRSDFSQTKLVECMRNLGMHRKVLVVFAMLAIVDLLVNFRSARRDQILLTGLVMKLGEIVPVEESATTIQGSVSVSQGSMVQCANIKQHSYKHPCSFPLCFESLSAICVCFCIILNEKLLMRQRL